MATGKSGSFKVTTSNIYISGTVSWSETYDVASNKSTVTAELRLSRTNTGYETYGSGEFTISIDGNKKTQTGTYSLTYLSNTLCIKHSAEISHDADGSKSITISVSGAIYAGNPNMTLSSQSGTAKLTKIPRASTMTFTSGTLGKEMTFTVTAASSSFTHQINWSAGGKSGTLSGSRSIKWTPPESLAESVPSGTKVPCSFTLITYSGSSKVGEKAYSINLTIPDNDSFKPDITLSAVTHVNGNITKDWGVFVQNKSKVQFSVTKKTGKYGASVTKITSSTASASGDSFTATPSSSGSVVFSVTATDSRGFSRTVKTAPITVLSYHAPLITSASVARCNQSGETDRAGTSLLINAAYSISKVGKNAAVLKARSRLAGSSGAYTDLAALSSGKNIVGGSFNIGASYEVQLLLTDSFGESDDYIAVVPTSDCVMNINSKGNGIGIGKYAEKENLLDIQWDASVHGDLFLSNGGVALPGKRIDATATDLNDYKTLGVYTFTAASAPTNRPDDNTNGILVVIPTLPDTDNSAPIKQIWYRYGGASTHHQTYVRTLCSAAEDWSEWIRFLTTKDTVPIANGGTGATSAADARTKLGAVAKAGDTMTGNLTVSHGGSAESGLIATRTDTGIRMFTGVSAGGDNHGIYSYALSKWLVSANSAGTITCNATAYSAFAWKKATVSFSSGSGSMSASGVATSSVVIATRGDAAMSGGNYASIGAADCNTAGTIKLGATNTISGNWVISAWWTK